VNNINDQLDATITILLIFVSTQHVSDNHLPIFRSTRLVTVVKQHPSHRTHSLRRCTPDLQRTTTLGQYITLL